MSEPRALVRNAASVEQVKRGKRREDRDEQERKNLVAAQLATPTGRAFVWSQLERAGIFDALYGPMEQVYFAVAERNAGLRLFTECKNEHPDAYLLMQHEALLRGRQRDAEVLAAQVATAGEGETDN